MVYDVREKMIPLYLVALFTGVSVVVAYLVHPNWQGIVIAMLIGFGALFFLFLKQGVGLADCFLLPSCFAWMELGEIGIFLVLCGFLGVLTAIFWRVRYHDHQFPFTPAILFSLSLVLLS